MHVYPIESVAGVDLRISGAASSPNFVHGPARHFFNGRDAIRHMERPRLYSLPNSPLHRGRVATGDPIVPAASVNEPPIDFILYRRL